MTTVDKRYDFVLLFDVQDGNPNGDPDAGNLPRIDAETGMGLVTDVCLKRKVRNFAQLSGQDIFIKEKVILNQIIGQAYVDLAIDLSKPPADAKKDGSKRNKPNTAQGSEVEQGRDHLCAKYYDIRAFGAVMTTGANAGQVRGPIQMTFARSVDPVVALEHSITICAARKEDKPIEEQIGIQGRKYTVPYGLYLAHGFVSANLASQTGFSGKDLDLFWNALLNMFEHDRSAARGLMSTRGLYVFEHSTALGNAPASQLFERVTVKRHEGSDGPARSFKDYEVLVDESDLGEVKILRKLG
jgi:CRISPR-associated protein Csd2